MAMPNFNSTEEGRNWLKNKISRFILTYRKSSTLEEKRKVLKDFSLNDIKAEEMSNPLSAGSQIKESEDYILIKNLLLDFFNWLYNEKSINASLEIYLDSFFSKSHQQKMPLIAEEILRLPALSEEEQIKRCLEIYKTVYETSLNHLKTLLEIILKKENIKINQDFGLKELKNNFSNYSKINELLGLFDNYSRNPIGHDSWIYEDGKLLFKTKGEVKEIQIKKIILNLLKNIMFQIAYQTIAIEYYQNLIKSNRLSEGEMDKIYIAFKKRLENI